MYQQFGVNSQWSAFLLTVLFVGLTAKWWLQSALLSVYNRQSRITLLFIAWSKNTNIDLQGFWSVRSSLVKCYCKQQNVQMKEFIRSFWDPQLGWELWIVVECDRSVWRAQRKSAWKLCELLSECTFSVGQCEQISHLISIFLKKSWRGRSKGTLLAGYCYCILCSHTGLSHHAKVLRDDSNNSWIGD